VLVGLVSGLAVPSPTFASALEGILDPPNQAGENRWVPSVAVALGVTIQKQSGYATSVLLEDDTPPPVDLGGTHQADDVAVTPFLGVDLQIMAPAIPIPTRPRFFLGAEILPTFAVSRDLAFAGNPDCLKGPEPNAVCARDEDGSRRRDFGIDAANGLGTRTTAKINPLSYGMSFGVAFPMEILERPVRFKAMAAFLSQRIDAQGLVVAGDCDPSSTCTDYTPILSLPPVPGFFREVNLSASTSERFYSVGPGFDLEIGTGRFGQLGSVIYIGMRAYKVFGDRTIEMFDSETYDDQIGQDEAFAQWRVEYDSWVYRANVGVRFEWLGKMK